MKTEIIPIKADLSGREEVMSLADRFTEYNKPEVRVMENPGGICYALMSGNPVAYCKEYGKLKNNIEVNW